MSALLNSNNTLSRRLSRRPHRTRQLGGVSAPDAPAFACAGTEPSAAALPECAASSAVVLPKGAASGGFCAYLPAASSLRRQPQYSSGIISSASFRRDATFFTCSCISFVLCMSRSFSIILAVPFRRLQIPGIFHPAFVTPDRTVYNS